MTSSAKQTSTETRPAGVILNLLAGGPALVALLLLLGWGLTLQVSNWHITPSVVVLWLGWAGVVATARFLLGMGLAVANRDLFDNSDFDLSESRRQELIWEKKSLLRAIKEIEFDRDLGKMSESDADEVMRFYRGRAIEVIKQLDGLSDAELTVAQRIDRDLQARLAVQTKAKKKAKPTETSDEKVETE